MYDENKSEAYLAMFCNHANECPTSQCACPDTCPCWKNMHFKLVSNKELDDYNKRYLLSDAEQDVIKKAIWFVSKGDKDWFITQEFYKELQQSVKNYEEIKNKLR